MSIFNRPHYTSEITDFIDALKKKKPSIEAEQRAGRALLWDKPVDRALWQEYRAGRVPQKSYVYYSYSEENK